MAHEQTQGVLDKEAMKALRGERKQWVEAASAKSRESRKAIKAVKEFLAKDSATVPEIAEAAGLPTDKTLWIIATMRKFGQVAEADKDGSYYRYALTGTDAGDE
ncbi:winged helix-turn-helix domain-containing protein [Oceanidesulfovibrio marinus]|uniref:Winged helix-turn-helix domain-containing protein n=1 Tax=Oceanidesulfovibrio marinus TaxID=370038 RepID=A0ABX6NAY9_9BACT|nr:winged helix-turn-helix domain-containing protein [Oceanidesulfovibrio marinus]QJT07754.1 winged helix-turn-helix domain-containing protein [Oceanidesulfovibrio marinus]